VNRRGFLLPKGRIITWGPGLVIFWGWVIGDQGLGIAEILCCFQSPISDLDKPEPKKVIKDYTQISQIEDKNLRHL
jgi:hypothetical protein